MAQSYTRQSSFSDGDTITAALFNNEYNQLVNAFAYSSTSASSTGHRHDGTTAHGGNIHTIGDLDFLNKIVVDSTNNRWGFFVEVSSAAVEQVRLSDGVLAPVTDSDVDLGTSSLYFKNAYIDTITTTGAITSSSTMQGTTITATTAFVPDASDGAALGTSSLEFSDLFLADGAVINFGDDQDVSLTHVADTGLLLSSTDQLQFGDSGTYIHQSADGVLDLVSDTEIEINATTIDINGAADVSGNLAVGGNLTVTGNATISGNLTFGDAASDTVAFSADVASNLLPSADNTYDIGASGSEWKDLYLDGTANIDSLVADTADINGGTVDGAIIGGSSAAAITGTAITGTSFVIGSADISEAELETIDGVTAGTVAASKAVVVDSNKDIGSFRNITLTGELDAGSLDVSGDADIDGTLETDALSINGTTVTSTAAELNILDGVTSTAAELNILDGVTASATDINLIDGITNGTVIASKAIITDANKDITGGRNITISGELDAATLDISGDADIDGTLEADAITIGGTTLAETISDTVGAMVGSNTETGITVTYEDGDNTLDFVIGTLNQDTTGTADNITVSANNSTDETVYPIFVDGATGSQGAESDTGLTYNPSTGMLTTTGVTATFTGNITGNVTGNTSGTAATVTGAAQSNITSLGTLTTLTVDNVIVNGTTIGHTSDTDLITLADGNVTIAGELDLTTLDVSGDADIDGTLEADAITVGGTALASVIAGTTVSNATLAATTTVTDSTANTNFPVVFHDESNALLDDTGALRYNPSTGELLVPKLTVAGTTTTADTVTMQASNAIIFEGATADSNETTLSIVDPTSDHTQYLVNQGGYIPVLAAATTTQISSTPAELNLLDGSSANTVVNSKAVIYGSSGELAGTLSTAAQTNITSLGTLTALTGGTGDFNWDSNTLVVDSSENKVGIGNASPDVSLDAGSNTDAIHVPSGTTAQRPGSPAAGYFRYNSTTGDFEGYTDAWGAIAGGGGGTAPAVDTMTGDGSDTTLTLTSAPANENATVVTIDGVVQHKSTYSVSSNTLTFSEAPPDDTAVECITWTNTAVNSALLMQDADGDTQIQVEESSDEDKIRFDTGGTERMIIDSTGLGIGTSSPSANIHIYSTADNKPHLLLENFQNADTDDAPIIELYTNDQTTGGIGDDTDVGVIRFTGDEKDSGGKETYAEIRGVAHDPGSGSSNKGNLSFFVQAAGDLNETLTLDEKNVGIGTASPDCLVEMTGAHTSSIGMLHLDSTDHAFISLDAAGASNDKGIYFQEAGTSVAVIDHDGSANQLRIHDGSTTHMVVNDDSKVGIGTTSPARNLVVSSSGQTDLSILAGTSASAQLQFGDSDDDNIGQIEYNNSTNAMMITTNASEAMRILSTGRLAIGTTTSDSPVTIGDSNTGSYSGTSYMKGTLRLYHSSNTDNRYVGMSMSHNGSTEGMFGYQRAGTASDLADFVWQGYDGNSNSYKELFRIKANGDLEAIDTSIASNSDERLKENIEDFTGGLDLISKLKPRTFTWKEPKQRKEGTVRGFVAQEVLDVDDYWISEQEAKEKEHPEYKYTKDTETVYLSKLSDKDAMYVSAIQEQQKTIEKLIKRIETLESK